MSWPDPPAIYKLYTPDSFVPPPEPPPVPADITPENIGSFLPEHFARVYTLPQTASREADGSIIIEANARVQALTSDMFKKLVSIQDDRYIEIFKFSLSILSCISLFLKWFKDLTEAL